MTDDPQPDDDDVDVPYAGTQILWGRVLVLLSALALAFWLGTTFAGDDGSRQEIRDQADEIARLQAQIAGLEAEIDARDAAAGQASEDASTAEPSDVASAEASQRQSRDQEQAADDDRQAEDDRQADDDRQAADDGGEQDAGGGSDGGGGEQDAGGGGDRAQDDDGDDEPRGRRYVVQSGDSLAAIAQEVYGDPTQWRAIARANDLREPYSLTVGEPLQIPASP